MHTLSLHDALPISSRRAKDSRKCSATLPTFGANSFPVRFRFIQSKISVRLRLGRTVFAIKKMAKTIAEIFHSSWCGAKAPTRGKFHASSATDISGLAGTGPSSDSIEVLSLPRKRQKFFANNLPVFHCVNADLGQLKSLFRVLLGHISVVLHDEPVMRDEWSFRDEAVNLHGIEPPIYFPAHLIDAAFLR